MTDSPRLAYDSLKPVARALVERWCAALGQEPPETLAMFRFLAAMAAARMGLLRELKRGERDGIPVVILVSERHERVYAVADPGLGEHEATAVEEMARLLGG